MVAPYALTTWTNRHPYVASLGIVAIVTGIGFAMDSVLHAPNVDIIYLLGVLVSALRWGRRPGIFTAIASTVVFDYCFVPPYFSWSISDLAYVVTLIGFVVVAIATSTLAARSRELIIAQAAQAQAEALNQAKDDILNKISHELRAPLNAVMGWTQLLEQTEPHTPPWSRSLAGLEHSAAMLARLVDDLLNACRVTSGKMRVDRQRIDLASVVSKAVDAARPAAEAKHVTLAAIVEPAGDAEADALRLEQIVGNLLANAIKFTPAGGRVEVRLTRAGDEAVLTVRDTGIGIRRDFLPHVFEQFSQADASHAREGLGLGLSIVHYLVAAHGGTIGVDSAGPGKGTTFTIHLPVLVAQYERV